MGAQTCNADGHSYGMCQCSSAGDDAASADAGSDGSSLADATVDAPHDSSTPLESGVDASGATDSAADASPVDAGHDACAGHVTFAGKTASQYGSNWTYGGMNGLAAGNAACQAVGADHVCSYDELVVSASGGELSMLTASDTAWLQRNGPVTVTATSPKIVVLGQPATVGTTYAVGLGSDCNEWNYSTDHLNDGEFVDFSTGTATPTFHFDDNPNAIQATPKDIPCGHNAMLRDVLCCYPACGD
jgi:hypothetical protein